MRILESAALQALEIIRANPIEGAQFVFEKLEQDLKHIGRWKKDLFSLNWEIGWACGCSLYVRMIPDENRKNPIWSLQCELSWGSTGRCIVTALAATNLYRQVIDLAAMLETAWAYPPVKREDETK